MTGLAFIGLLAWGFGLVYLLMSEIFGLPLGIEVMLTGSGLMAIGIVSVMIQGSRFDTYNEGDTDG